MVVVAEHRPDLGEPAAIRAGVTAQGFLDRRVDKDATHLRLLRHGLEKRHVGRRPDRRIDIEAVLPHHIRC
jgi:hypothetical protein